MARRDIFRNIKDAANQEPERTERKPSTGYTAHGATRNILTSIGELREKAVKADQLLEGEVITELDPALIDPSFVSDRMEDADDEAFNELVAAIRERGQDSPVLVRPHPDLQGRYQVTFGHRRVRATRLLGRPVRAIVRAIADTDHVVAQGQENSARKNLSFIERALFAQQLIDKGYDRATVQAALTIDNPLLTRMLSVTSRVPEAVARSIGSCKGVGRDRWLDFAQTIERPDSRVAADAFIKTPEFSEASSDACFDLLLAEMKRAGRPRKASAAKPEKSKWQPADKALSAELTDTGKAFAVSFKLKDASRFGRYLAENLDRLYGEFKQRENEDR